VGKPFIFRLFAPRCPTAISRFVIAAWINAIKRQTVRFFAHVGEKSFERIEPSFANRDALGSILLKLWNIRIETSRFHVSPTQIGRGNQLSSTVSVFKRSSGEERKFIASATGCVSPSQAAASGDNFSSAVAKTQPARCGGDMRESQYGQTTETLPRDINEFGQWRSPFRLLASSGGRAFPRPTVALLIA
jgi:hypothetical protein